MPSIFRIAYLRHKFIPPIQSTKYQGPRCRSETPGGNANRGAKVASFPRSLFLVPLTHIAATRRRLLWLDAHQETAVRLVALIVDGAVLPASRHISPITLQ